MRAASGASVSTRVSAAAKAGPSPGGTSRPTPPTTSGSAPLVEATTGVPAAIASTATRPNCSTHDAVVSEGTASTSTLR